MPRKQNKRKAIQAAKRSAQAAPEPRRVQPSRKIAMDTTGLGVAVLAAEIVRNMDSKEPKADG